jgi:NHL repeat-containing protein
MHAKLGDVLRGGLISAALAVVTLGGCGGSSGSPSPGPPPSSPPPTDSQIYVTAASGSQSSANQPDTVVVFTIASLLTGSGSLAPKQQFQSPSFSGAFGVALDSTANIYVIDQPTATVDVFFSNANNTVSPTRQISSSAMTAPMGIALDSSNNIYVADPTGGPSTTGQIDVFSSSQSGSVSPVRTISGSNTLLNQPGGIAVNSNGTIFVTNEAGNSVEQFAAGATGNVAPTRVISGVGSLLSSPLGISIGPSGALYVANSNNQTVTVYGASGNTPVRTITGGNTNLFIPNGTATDVAGHLYVADGGPPGSSSNPTGELLVFQPNATGNITPLLTAQGVGFATWGIARF